ncbi:MAG: tRNA 5-methylaminomethyl-2-thiouridine biosynthesis bifunctional protein MnmC [Planctomycetota bacterium]
MQGSGGIDLGGLGDTTHCSAWPYGATGPSTTSALPAPRPFHEQDPWGEKTHTYVRAQGFGAAPDPAPGRWAGQRQWTVAELGTGTGCALACLVAAFERHAHPLQRLHYVGFERDPGMLDWWRDPASRAAIPPAERKALESILARPIRSTQGITRWRLLDGRATITLVLGDATQWLPHLSFRADAWFLDAYEPAIEDRLWSPEVLAQVARLSAAGATASTFSAAAVVRHGLHAAGFDVQRQAGFDTKRHMTTAVRRSHDASASIEPWFAPPEPAPPDCVTVVGAGLAGAWCARVFAERGVHVTVVEPTPGIARASDVPMAAAAQPGGSWQSEQVRVHDAAWHLLASRCVDLGLPHRVLPITTPGVAPNAPAGQPTRIARPASAGPTHAIAPDTPAGEPTRMAIVAAPREIISALLDHPRIRREPSMPSTASFVVQCTAFLPDAMTDAACARGAPVPNAGSIACASLVRPLDTAIMDRGYALPHPTAARAWVGATNHPGRWSPPQARSGASQGTRIHAPTDSASHATHVELGHEEQAALDALAREVLVTPVSWVDAWSGVRAASPDHLPLTGPVCGEAAFTRAFEDIRHGPLARAWPPCPYEPGRWCSIGHGSHGMLTAPLAAELIADLAFGTPRCLTDELLPFLLPQRFALRHLRRVRG